MKRKNRKWTALLCCGVLLLSPVNAAKGMQGGLLETIEKKVASVQKKSSADGKDSTKEIQRLQEKRTKEKYGVSISVKKERELMNKTDFTLEDVPEEVLESAEVEPEEVKAVDDVDSLDLHSFTTINEDNSRTLHIFDSPIKYYDNKENEVKFIDNSLEDSDEAISSKEEYAYENTENSIKVYLPETSGEYVAVTDSEDYSLSFSPVGEKEVSVKKKMFRFLGEREEIAEYADAFGVGCDLQYVPQNDGVKENILLRKENDQYEFSFHVKAPGLRPDCQKGQQITFLNQNTGEAVFTLGKLFLRDSYTGNPDGAEHLSFDNSYRIEQTDKENYILTYVLDRNFLKSSTTQYPVLVDPSITPDKDVYDAPVYSGKAGQNFGGNAYAEIGKVSNNFGVGYGYFQMQGVEDYTYINPKNVQKATLRVYEGSGTTYASKILAYDTSKEWRSAAITWNNRPGKRGGALSSHTIKKSGFYEFAITSCVRNWLADYLGEGGFSKKRGIMLAPDSHSQGRKDICTTNHGTASKRPCFKIEYTEDTSIETGTYFLQNYNSKLNLAVDEKTVVQDKITNKIRQQWTVKSLANGYYSIANRYHGGTGYLTAHNNDDKPSIWVDGTGDPVRFKIIKNNDGTGTYRIHSKLGDNLETLSICNGSLQENAKAGFSYYTDHAKRKWTFKKVPAAQLQADISISGITNYQVTTVTTHPFSVTLYSPYNHVPTTDTLFQMYDSSGALEYSSYVSTPAFKGDTSRTVTLNWKPKKIGRYTVKVTADGKNVYGEANENNNVSSKTIDVIKGYTIQVNNYYDEGFLVRYGTMGINQMNRVTKFAQEFYRDMFGLWLVIPAPEKMTSLMDECKKSNQGGVKTENLDKPCTHSGGIHTEKYDAFRDFDRKCPTNTTTAKRINIQWTGHYTFNKNIDKDENRSFTYREYNAIAIYDIIKRESWYSTADMEKAFFERMRYVFIHELAHDMAAPDHYCYNGEKETGKCGNGVCVICYKKDLKQDCEKCIMFNPIDDFKEKTDWQDIFCKYCTKDIKDFLDRLYI